MKYAFSKFAVLFALPVAATVQGNNFTHAQAVRTLRPGEQVVAPEQAVTPSDRRPASKEHNLTTQDEVVSNHVSMDHLISHCISLSAQEEIAFSEFGRDKTKNADVKAFAEMMMKDHMDLAKRLPRKYVSQSVDAFNQSHLLSSDAVPKHPRSQELTVKERLERANKLAGVTDPAEDKLRDNLDGEVIQREVLKPALPDKPQEVDEGGAPLVTSAPETQHTVGHSSQENSLLNIQTEITKQCLEDTKAKLSKESGETFDASFVGFQIAMHQAMQSKLTVFQRHASPELKPIVSKAMETTEQHLKHAEKLMEKLAAEQHGK